MNASMMKLSTDNFVFFKLYELIPDAIQMMFALLPSTGWSVFLVRLKLGSASTEYLSLT